MRDKDPLRVTPDTIPAQAIIALPDGSIDLINIGGRPRQFPVGPLPKLNLIKLI